MLYKMIKRNNITTRLVGGGGVFRGQVAHHPLLGMYRYIHSFE